MTPLIQRFLRDERGSTAIEYGLIISLLVLAIVTAVGSVGDKVQFLFGDTSSALVEALKG